MGMRMDYEVRILPDDFITERVEYAFEEDPKQKKDRYGNARTKMVTKLVQERGGVLIVVRGKPGHSIRLTSLDQALDLKLIDADMYASLGGAGGDLKKLRPRLVDTGTGEEVNEYGVPLNIAHELANGTTMPKNARRHARGNVDTDIDVNTTGDEDIAGNELPNDGVMSGREHVDKTIDKVE
jgi:hypothetical protein